MQLAGKHGPSWLAAQFEGVANTEPLSEIIVCIYRCGRATIPVYSEPPNGAFMPRKPIYNEECHVRLFAR